MEIELENWVRTILENWPNSVLRSMPLIRKCSLFLWVTKWKLHCFIEKRKKCVLKIVSEWSNAVAFCFFCFQMLFWGRAGFTWRTSWSTPGRTRCTWSRRSCRASRSQAQEDRQGWDHTVGSILTAAPLRRWGPGTTGSGGCPGRWRRCCWCWDGRSGWWTRTWAAWRDSLWGSGGSGRKHRLRRVTREVRGWWLASGTGHLPRGRRCTEREGRWRCLLTLCWSFLKPFLKLL